MRPIDADEILCDGFSEWLGCVLCGRATAEHPSCDGACDMQARIYADRAADALVSWLADVPTIDAEPVRHGHWVKHPAYDDFDICTSCGTGCRRRIVDDGWTTEYGYIRCPHCGAKMDEVEVLDEVSE